MLAKEANKKKGKGAKVESDEDMDDEEALMRELTEMDSDNLEDAKKTLEDLKKEVENSKREAVKERDAGNKTKALSLMKEMKSIKPA